MYGCGIDAGLRSEPLKPGSRQVISASLARSRELELPLSFCGPARLSGSPTVRLETQIPSQHTRGISVGFHTTLAVCRPTHAEQKHGLRMVHSCTLHAVPLESTWCAGPATCSPLQFAQRRAPLREVQRPRPASPSATCCGSSTRPARAASVTPWPQRHEGRDGRAAVQRAASLPVPRLSLLPSPPSSTFPIRKKLSRDHRTYCGGSLSAWCKTPASADRFRRSALVISPPSARPATHSPPT